MSRQPWRLRVIHEGEEGILLTHPDGSVRLDGSRPGDGALPIRTGLHGAVQIPAGVDSLPYRLPSGRVRSGGVAHAVSMDLSGSRLVYLGHALHPETSPDWVTEAAARWSGADWLMVGMPEDGGEAVLEYLPAFGAAQVMVLDLRPPARSGKITTRIARWVDQLKTAGLPVMGVAPQVSVRFE